MELGRPQRARQPAGSEAEPPVARPRAARERKQTRRRSARASRSRSDGAPLPDFVEPCLARLEAIALQPERLGARDQVRRLPHPGAARRTARSRLLTRKGLDWTRADSNPSPRRSRRFAAATALIDGEIVVEGADRRVRLLRPAGGPVRRGASDRFVYYVVRSPASRRRAICVRSAAARAQGGAEGAARRRARPGLALQRASRRRRHRRARSTPAACGSKASCRSAATRPIAPAAPATGSSPNAPDRQEFVIGGFSAVERFVRARSARSRSAIMRTERCAMPAASAPAFPSENAGDL